MRQCLKSITRARDKSKSLVTVRVRQLCTHPLLAPQLSRLVLLGEGVIGYPVSGGQGLRDYNDKVEPVKPDEKLRIAHCFDLYTLGEWEKWQADCFRRERVQPFKQVFRELYLLTAQERADGTASVSRHQRMTDAMSAR